MCLKGGQGDGTGSCLQANLPLSLLLLAILHNGLRFCSQQFPKLLVYSNFFFHLQLLSWIQSKRVNCLWSPRRDWDRACLHQSGLSRHRWAPGSADHLLPPYCFRCTYTCTHTHTLPQRAPGPNWNSCCLRKTLLQRSRLILWPLQFQEPWSPTDLHSDFRATIYICALQPQAVSPVSWLPHLKNENGVDGNNLSTCVERKNEEEMSFFTWRRNELRYGNCLAKGLSQSKGTVAVV